ncbi:hypothetical protein BD626DRAFT_497076 [Schizophyllum amplum]|uniref:Actin-like ATPase domain-containing protein n=1 Tax=Schizophyllum amplum TaxID=97359 RepID=A0A550CDT8_9AGAR|nr:hypothetical protein BD626DRAFT_497076 [Auriculariopsis ampla]
MDQTGPDRDLQVHAVPFPSLPVPQAPPSSYSAFRGSGTPLVIDNGSTTFRYGFATSKEPRTSLNVMARYKERKTNKPLLLFGDGIEVESGAKAQAKYPWEGDVLLNFDALENVLDCAFVNLGIDTNAVEHPVLMTERIASPMHSRILTSELMFEQYHVPSVAYCLDGVMSFYGHNHTARRPFTADGLVISFNTASTSVIPILNGRGILSHAKRLQWGTSQASDYLLKLVQLKYPTFPTRVTPMQSSWMMQNFCEFAADYRTHVKLLSDHVKLKEVDRVIQYPFIPPAWEEKTEEELAKVAERRREQGKKLQEIAAKNRLDRAAKKDEDLQRLLELRDSRDDMDEDEWQTQLEEYDFNDATELDEAIEKSEADIKRSKKKDADGDEIMDEPSYPLLDVPDEDLDEDDLKEKKKQRLLKAGQEARARARKEKEKEKEQKEREDRLEQDEREADLKGWSQRHREEHEALMQRINKREKHKEALADRRSAAAQARMKSIATLAADERVPKRGRKMGGDDTFGANDDDWDEYRKITATAPAEDQEEDLKRLMALEEKLLVHDPTFTEDHTHAAILQKRTPLLCAFKPAYSDWDIEGANRIHLNTERFRACETWFSPGMAGLDSAGLGEVIQNILARFTYEEKGRMIKNVFLTGTPSRFPGLIERLHNALRPIMPPDMPIDIVRAADPSLDAWKGMAAFARTSEFRTVGVTRQEYEEHGGERIRRWWGGNWNGATL